MRKFLIHTVFLFTSLVHIQCQNTTPSAIPTFPPLETMDAVSQWEKQGEFWYVQEPESPYSPRMLSAITGPDFGVSSFLGAFKDLEGDDEINIKVKQRPTFEKLEAYEKWDGTDLRISITPTNYGNTDGILYLLISKPLNDENYHIIGLEMTEKTYKEWGGVIRLMILRDIIKSPSAFPEERRAQIINAPLDNQVRLYEESLNALQEHLAEQMIVLSQAQTLLVLQNLQFDQILNNEMTSPFEH